MNTSHAPQPPATPDQLGDVTRYVTTNQAAEHAQVPAHVIRDWARRRLIRAVGRFGRQQVYDLGEVFAAERETRPSRRHR